MKSKAPADAPAGGLPRPGARVESARSRERKPWTRPRLRAHGDLRGLTLGPSPGLGESGNPAAFRV